MKKKESKTTKKTAKPAAAKRATPAKAKKVNPKPKATAAKKAVKPATKKATKATPVKATTAKKPVKTTAVKAVKQPRTPKQKPLKHTDKDEMTIDKAKPIIIKKGSVSGKANRRASRRELKRVAKTGGYTVFDGARAGKTFATPEEAMRYALDVYARTGETVAVSKTDRQITHTFKQESKET